MRLRSAPAATAIPVPSTADLARPPGGPDKPTGVAATPATRLRVLEREGRFAKVRDTEGNEGWVDSDAL